MKNLSPNKLIFGVALLVLTLDQASKQIVMRALHYSEEVMVLDGFFRFVYWGNTGAAWSMFRDNNFILAFVSVLALFVLYFVRRHFGVHLRTGQVALGMILGGILGNLTDRVIHHHVIDFIYFYVNRRGGGELGFPAFNLADTAICTGVGLIFLISWLQDSKKMPEKQAA